MQPDDAAGKTVRRRIVLAKLFRSLFDQFRRPGLIRQTSLHAPSEVEELLAHLVVRAAVRRTFLVSIGPPDATQIGLAIRRAQSGRVEIGRPVSVLRKEGSGTVEPLRAERRRQEKRRECRDAQCKNLSRAGERMGNAHRHGVGASGCVPPDIRRPSRRITTRALAR
jgi:hypothetical protein